MFKRLILLALLAVTICSAVSINPAYAYDELKNTDPDKYYVLLDLKNQYITVFERDENGEYTKVVRRFICTTGRTEVDETDPEDEATPTPSGKFKMGGRERFGKFLSFGGTYARYWTQVVNGIYFHSILYSRRDLNTLQSSAFRHLGSKVSHGCIRLYVEDAKWLYYYACPGTTVEITNKLRSDRATTKKLKTRLSFSEYKALQKKIYDDKELPNPKAWIVKSSADMRTGNGFNDKIIKRLKTGAEVEVLQSAEPWCKIKHSGREGYIRTAYLTFEKDTVNSKKDANIMRSIAWMYTEPSAKSKMIIRVPVFSSIKILEPNKGGWTKIEYWNETGYVLSKAITKGWGVKRD